MDREAMQRAFDDVFDQALVFHAFTDYMRDYEVITFATADPRTGIAPSFDRYLFRYCVQAHVSTTLPADSWRRSLDERLIDFEAASGLEGFVWGVKWQGLYPGIKLVESSAAAARWSDELGLAFHEVVIATNTHRVELVFSDLSVTTVEPGYAPFTVTPD